MTRFVILIVRAYQVFFSPLFLPACRYQPSCSQYAIEALSEHGFWHGVRLTAARLLRCHPLHPGGVDPVPGRDPGASKT